MQESDPPYLTVGTEVSAKYKGAFCEAKIRKVVRVVKCKVTFKSGLGSVLLSDDQIKGHLRVGANVEARHPDKNAYIEAVINKIQDCSQYTVVFDDGDITTLRRSALCLKSGRHFNESDTLDHLPLTHPEHFSNPVVGGRRNVRRKRDPLSGELEGDESGDEEPLPPTTKPPVTQFTQDDSDVDIGKVVCVEITDKKKGKDSWFPAVIVSPSAQETVKIKTKDEYLVRSFRDGRYYTVPKKEITSFSKDSHGQKNDANSNILKLAIEKAVQFIDKNELPAHWDKDVLFSAVDDPTDEVDDEGAVSDESEEDSQAEEKDLFVAKLYKYMEERGTPINKVPVVCSRDLDLHKLYKVVIGRGGYNKVTNSSQWKSVTVKMGFGSMPSTSTINLVKQGYKKFIHNFEEFTRKLGCNFPAGPSSTSSRSNRIMFRDRHSSSSFQTKAPPPPKEPAATATSATATAPKEESPPVEDPAPPPPSTPPPPPPPAEEEAPKKEDDTRSEGSTPRRSRHRQKKDDEEKTPSKKRPRAKEAEKSAPAPSTPSSTTSEPALPLTPTTLTIPSPAASPAKRSSGRGKYKRKGEKEEVLEAVMLPEEFSSGRESISKETLVQIGDKLSVYYGKEAEGKIYEAKVVDKDAVKDLFFVHYAGWNNRYDEWIPRWRVADNLSLRSEQVTSVPQGRGPSSTSDGGTVSDSGTPGSFKGPLAGKVAKKKLKTAVPNVIKTKAIVPRKRLSSEGDATSIKRQMRKRALSGGEPTGDSSESEGKTKSPKRIRKAKKIYDPGAGDWKRSVPSPDILDISSEDRPARTESAPSTTHTQVIDMNKLRCELKGIDKIDKVALPPSGVGTIGTETIKPEEAIESKPTEEQDTVSISKDTNPAEEQVVKELQCEETLLSPTASPQKRPAEVTSPKLIPQAEEPDIIELERVSAPRPATTASFIEITPAPAKVKVAATIRVPIPTLPVLVRAASGTSPAPTPLRTTTPITISTPLRAQRPILIKAPVTTAALITPVAEKSDKDVPAPSPLVIPPTTTSKDKPLGIPIVTLITTTASVPVTNSAPVQTQAPSHGQPPRADGPKLAAYPTARIRGAAPGTLGVTTSSRPLSPTSIKKRRRVKSQKFVDSSESSDEHEVKRKRTTYAPKTSFKPVSLQVQPAPMTGTAGPSTTVGAVVASASSSAAVPALKKPLLPMGPSAPPKVTPIMKVQLGGSEKKSGSGKILSGKYSRVEPGLKSKKHVVPTAPTALVRAAAPSGMQPQSVIVKKLATGPVSTIALVEKPAIVTQPVKPEEAKEEGGESLKKGSDAPFVAFRTVAATPDAGTAGKAGGTDNDSLDCLEDISSEESARDFCSPEKLMRHRPSSIAESLEGLAHTTEVAPEVPPPPSEESCHSLLCEEEIPGSPTPMEGKPFVYEDSNATEFLPKMTLPVGRAESVLNPSIFASVVPPKVKPLSPSGIALLEKEEAEPVEQPLLEALEEGVLEAMESEVRQEPEDEADLENSPMPMSSPSTSISTGSPRDAERNSIVEEIKSKEFSDTDSIDMMAKCEDIGDENTSTDEDPDQDYSYDYSKSSGRSRSPSSSPRKRRLARQESADESPPRSYRTSHRSSLRRGLDADYGRMPPPQPPVNLGKPPYSEKYNFIPVLTDSMSSDERVDKCMTGMDALREKWKELKSELSFYDRKKKRIRKRKREMEKREKEKEAPKPSTVVTT